ncbi:hypothetical protein ABZ916_23475 [Streptomyces sp. NPDC046853]|uniref:hypothetical protein n=1 Tax=Streptomyces sp. NPDC046853 TaxID=3154920 RepID=UPI003410F0AC
MSLPTAKEARRVVEDLAAKEASESLDPVYWRGIYEGPLLDQTLARVQNIKKRGRDKDPSNRPERDAQIHTWTAHASGAGSDAWILAARQVSAHTVGDSRNRVDMAWSLYHQQRANGAWRKAFVSHAPTKTSLPPVAADKKKGTARTVAPDAGLGLDPMKACGELSDYVTKKGSSSTRHEWSKQIDTFRSTFDDKKLLRREAGGAQSVSTKVEARRSPLGPVWRTDDGGALVPCVSVGTLTADMGPGRWTRFGASGWDGTSDIKWNKYTQSTMRMEVLKIPAGRSDIGFAAESIWPYEFDGTKYSGS